MRILQTLTIAPSSFGTLRLEKGREGGSVPLRPRDPSPSLASSVSRAAAEGRACRGGEKDRRKDPFIYRNIPVQGKY